MSANVTISWTVPTLRDDKVTPMVISAIRIEKRVEGIAEWTVINELPGTATSLIDQDVPSGRWHYRGIVVPTEGPESDPVEGEVTIALAKAGTLQSFSVSLLPQA